MARRRMGVMRLARICGVSLLTVLFVVEVMQLT